MKKELIASVLKQIVEGLYFNNIEKIIEDSIDKRVKSELIRAEIKDYPGELSLLSNESLQNFEVHKLDNENQVIVIFFFSLMIDKANL